MKLTYKNNKHKQEMNSERICYSVFYSLFCFSSSLALSPILVGFSGFKMAFVIVTVNKSLSYINGRQSKIKGLHTLSENEDDYTNQTHLHILTITEPRCEKKIKIRNEIP